MRGALFGLGIFAAACSAAPDAAVAPPGQGGSVSALGCGPGKAALADGSCFSVGPEAPTDGPLAQAFVRSPDGWGLAGVAAASCAGDERADLGSETCVPVDDCAAAFPPANADVTVSNRARDVRSVTSIAAALARVKPGGVIAVDKGTYPSVNVDKDVTIVGMCAGETVVGNGKNNAFYVSGGAKVTLRSMTLVSAASPIGVDDASVVAERVIVRESKVGLGAVGPKANLTFRDSLLVGLGTTESIGAMVAQGGSLSIEGSELRDVTSGVMSTDEGSRAELRRTVVRLSHGKETQSGLAANQRGHLVFEGGLVTSENQRLVGVHRDMGTMGSAVARAGTMVVRSSVLEQLGSELEDSVVDVTEGGELELTDVTLRHQSMIGILSSGVVRAKRLAILGDPTVAEIRAGIMASGERGELDLEGLAIPWAQGVGVGMEDGKLSLRASLIANVAARGQSGHEGLLLTGGKTTLSDCELVGNEQQAIVAIGGASVEGERLFVHDTKPGDAGNRAPEGFGLLALHAAVTLKGSVFRDNVEGIVAAASAIALDKSAFSRHRVALRAMDGMSVREDAADLAPNALSLATCTFEANQVRTSTETLPQLNAAPF